jgi:hypothetical protein
MMLPYGLGGVDGGRHAASLSMSSEAASSCNGQPSSLVARAILLVIAWLRDVRDNPDRDHDR